MTSCSELISWPLGYDMELENAVLVVSCPRLDLAASGTDLLGQPKRSSNGWTIQPAAGLPSQLVKDELLKRTPEKARLIPWKIACWGNGCGRRELIVLSNRVRSCMLMMLLYCKLGCDSEAQGLVNTTDCRRWCNEALGDGNVTPVNYEVEDAVV